MSIGLIGQRRFWIGIGVAVAIAGAIAVVTATGHASGPAPSAFFLKCVEPYAAHEGEALADVEHECHVREEASKGLTPAKMRAEEEALHATRAARFAAAAAQEAAGPQPERITGLQQGPGGPPGTSQIFASTGVWSGQVNGQWYQVYAGTKTEPGTGQGLRSELLVFLAPAHVGGTERARELGAYAPPEGGTKALEIESASGAVLTIKTATGSTLKFNVATQAFES
jgi:hypothetical protein